MGDVHSTAAPTRVAAIRLIFFITFSSLLGPSWGALAGSQFRPYNNWLSFGQFLAIRPLAIVVALIVGGVCSAQAAHKDAKHCADDYRKFCHQWGLETKGLENCMRKHGDTLTNACVAALVKAGEISQAEVNRRKKALGR
jgi:hypothetical protein